jgi:hypothetical protein
LHFINGNSGVLPVVHIYFKRGIVSEYGFQRPVTAELKTNLAYQWGAATLPVACKPIGIAGALH